tara:strand:+ start:1115 stop:1285 length:171 start_codon:yes stop_codon:yes gene_type:complete
MRRGPWPIYIAGWIDLFSAGLMVGEAHEEVGDDSIAAFSFTAGFALFTTVSVLFEA